MLDRAIEIITGKERRRRWSAEEKLRIVAETAERGARVTDVAARHDVYPSLLFNWRRQVREGRLGTAGSAGFVPIRLLSSSREATAPPEDRGAAGIEITLPDTEAPACLPSGKWSRLAPRIDGSAQHANRRSRGDQFNCRWPAGV